MILGWLGGSGWEKALTSWEQLVLQVLSELWGGWDGGRNSSWSLVEQGISGNAWGEGHIQPLLWDGADLRLRGGELRRSGEEVTAPSKPS